jgi:taurine dioxygenase
MQQYHLNKLSPELGAEISRIDLSQDFNEEIQNKIYEDLIQYKVLFFRNQDITPHFHVEFAKSFGSIEEPHPVYPHVDGFPEIVLLENDRDNPPDTDEWHTDVTFKNNPPFASVLYSKTIPQVGGDTLWSSLSKIYDALPNELKAQIENLRAIHDMGSFRNNYMIDDNRESSIKLNKGFQEFGNAVHSVVKVHPISNEKFLYINPSFTSQIVGMTTTDSNNLLSYLFNFMSKPEFQIRFKWTPNTLVIWDNRCTMHYAIGDYMPEKRVMHRVTVLNDRRD